MINIEYYLVLSAAIFCIGVYGVLARRNAILILMSIELMLQAVNINLIAFSTYLIPKGELEEHLGFIFAIFVITIAAAEVALGLAVVIAIYRNRRTVDISRITMTWVSGSPKRALNSITFGPPAVNIRPA